MFLCFQIDNNWRLHVSRGMRNWRNEFVIGDAGDAFNEKYNGNTQNGYKFSTKEQDPYGCAAKYQS